MLMLVDAREMAGEAGYEDLADEPQAAALGTPSTQRVHNAFDTS